MEIAISRHGPLTIKEQIKRQIRHLVCSGHFDVGQPLPSSKQMAQVLGVNRNTVAVAFQELAAEGVLEARVGSGTFIKEIKPVGNTVLLHEIFSDAFRRACNAGVSIDQIEDYLSGYMAMANVNLKSKTALVVECNREALDDISATLRGSIGVKTQSMLIGDLEKCRDTVQEICSKVDIVVCGFNHVREFLDIAPQPPCDVVGVLLKPNILILNELARLASGTRVGFICATDRSTRTFYKDFLQDGGDPRLTVAWMGMDDADGVRELIRSCDVVFATNYVFDRVSTLAGHKVRLVRVDLSIDPANVELVRSRLMTACFNKGVPL